MNWLFVTVMVAFTLTFVFLMLYVILAILESNRQRVILFTTLACIFWLLLAMMLGKMQKPPAAQKQNLK